MSYEHEPVSPFRGTTICAVKRDGVIAIAGDGQVTMGEKTIMKGTAKKVRRIFGGKVVIGFAGSVADAFALSEKFEDKLTQYSGNLPRAAVELAQDWRMDRAMRKLEALLLCADKENLMLISGTGEVIEPDDGILAVGSGGGLQCHGIHATDFREHALKLVHGTKAPLDGLLGLQRVDVGEPWQGSDLLVHARVVLHRARSERIEAIVDPVGLLGELGVVTA